MFERQAARRFRERAPCRLRGAAVWFRDATLHPDSKPEGPSQGVGALEDIRPDPGRPCPLDIGKEVIREVGLIRVGVEPLEGFDKRLWSWLFPPDRARSYDRLQGLDRPILEDHLKVNGVGVRERRDSYPFTLQVID